ncbi:MAG: hypothetical protein ACI4UX_00025 [Clostridia bacterium]
MENASKALIIAGSVLIAILLISLGLLIFKSTSGTTDQTQELGKTLEVQQFNSQFLKYCGESVKGSQVRTLCEVIIAHNANSKNQVKIAGNDDADAISNYRNTIKTNSTYKVEASYENGLITAISVTSK